MIRIRARLLLLGALPLVFTIANGCGNGSPPGPERELSSIALELRAHVGDTELSRMSAWLKSRYEVEDVVDTIDVGGVLFDCIPFARQQSVRDLFAVGVPVSTKMGPSMSELEQRDFDSKRADSGPDESLQSCPDGHVPQRRIALSEVARFSTLARYRNKHPIDQQGPAPLESSTFRDYATIGQSLKNYGADSVINIWSPYAEVSDQTISQIWIGGGSPNTTARQTVEAGWRVNDLNGPKVFVYTMGGTKQGYGTDGGFVQTSKAITLDSPLPYSVAGGTQQEALFSLKKEGDKGDWWFGYKGQWIGYWPRGQFATTGLANSADDIKFGGEVFDYPSPNSNVHTKSDMGGDGSFAAAGYKHAAYQRSFGVYQGDGIATSYSAVTGLAPFLVSSPGCYDMKLFADAKNAWKNWMYFGGPGYSAATCPTAR